MNYGISVFCCCCIDGDIYLVCGIVECFCGYFKSDELTFIIHSKLHLLNIFFRFSFHFRLEYHSMGAFSGQSTFIQIQTVQNRANPFIKANQQNYRPIRTRFAYKFNIIGSDECDSSGFAWECLMRPNEHIYARPNLKATNSNLYLD